LSAGLADSKTKGLANQRVCPVPVFFCDNGFVPFQIVTANTEFSSRTPSYNGTISTLLSPSTTLSARISRATVPNVGGTLTDTESYGASLAYAYSERLTSTLSYSHFSSAFTGLSTTAASNTLQSLAGTLGYSLADNWSLNSGASWSRSSVNPNFRDAFAIFVTVGKTWPNNRLWP
jgi:hypothetical protein